MPTMRISLRAFLPVSLALAAAACRGPLPKVHFEEVPPGSGTWIGIAAEPAWVKAPPANPGHVRLVVESQSNVRSIALGNLVGDKPMADRVRLALRTVVTSPEADAAAKAVPASLRLVHRACCDELLTHDMVPGNTLATVWGLYEVPIADLANAVTEPHRALARAALEKL